MQVCRYVAMHVCTYACVYVLCICMCICIDVHMSKCICAHVSTCCGVDIAHTIRTCPLVLGRRLVCRFGCSEQSREIAMFDECFG